MHVHTKKNHNFPQLLGGHRNLILLTANFIMGTELPVLVRTKNPTSAAQVLYRKLPPQLISHPFYQLRHRLAYQYYTGYLFKTDIRYAVIKQQYEIKGESIACLRCTTILSGNLLTSSSAANFQSSGLQKSKYTIEINTLHDLKTNF
jgi:hypothetical protein